MNCLLCDEPIEDGEETYAMSFQTEKFTGVSDVHRECILRSAAGGIGHWEDHAYWCVQMQDPDGGRTKRQSAREVAALIRERGFDATLSAHD